jgi:cytochrome c-type biogenesis protein CcmH
MTMFLIIAGLLTIVALLFVLVPLFGGKKSQKSTKRSEANLSIYRDQLRELDADMVAGTLSEAQYQNARNELEKRVLQDSSTVDEGAADAPSSGRWLVISAVVAVPVLTTVMYLMLGKPEVLDPQQKPSDVQSQVITQAKIEEMVKGLEQKLEKKPDDADGWAMLGRSYSFLRRFEDASAAYARAAALAPNNAQLLADYADVLAMTKGRSMQGEPEKIINQALQADSNNIKALALAGTAAFQRHDYSTAIEMWQKILKLVPADSPVARSVSASISQAQGLSGQTLKSSQAASGKPM